MLSDTKNGEKELTRQRGFSLIEVMISMAIFAIGVLAVGSMQMMAVSSNKSARVQGDAALWAMDRLERLKGLPFDHDDLKATAGTPHQEAVPGHVIQWEVFDNVPIPDTKRIRVHVAQSAGKMQKPVTVWGIRADQYD